MILRWLLASAHLLALAIGFAAIIIRARALGSSLDGFGLRRVLAADNWWGLAAFLWIGTGLARVLLGTEKATAYYTGNPVFWLKMGLFGMVFLLELLPMITLIQWRNALRRSVTPDLRSAPRLATISWLEAALVLSIIFVATALARGIGFSSLP